MTQPALTAYQQAYFEESARLGVEPGKCFCRCRADAPICTRYHRRKGMIPGDFFRFVQHHSKRKHPQEYVAQDRGYKTPCWIWMRGTTKAGHGFRYGVTRRFGTKITTQAHREYYERHVGPIAEGLVIDHLCRQTLCVNPEHLEAVTQQVNMSRAMSTKLSSEDVSEIIRLRSSGEKQRVLAERFGVHPAHISKICSGRKWREKKSPPRTRRVITDADRVKPARNLALACICPQCGGQKTVRGELCWRCWHRKKHPPRSIDPQIYLIDGLRCRKILLTHGQSALLPESWYNELSSEFWQAHWSPRTRSYYAACARKDANGKQYGVSMHRLIAGAEDGEVVDHINRDTLDNRPCNLRRCTNQQNCQNRRLLKVSNTSGYRGVTRRGKQWIAQIQGTYIGSFQSAEDAARAYDVAARKLFGEFAVLNFATDTK